MDSTPIVTLDADAERALMLVVMNEAHEPVDTSSLAIKRLLDVGCLETVRSPLAPDDRFVRVTPRGFATWRWMRERTRT